MGDRKFPMSACASVFKLAHCVFFVSTGICLVFLAADGRHWLQYEQDWSLRVSLSLIISKLSWCIYSIPQ